MSTRRSETGTFTCPRCTKAEHSRTNLEHHMERWHGVAPRSTEPAEPFCGHLECLLADRCKAKEA